MRVAYFPNGDFKYGGQIVRSYRLYVLDRDGHVKEAPQIIECKDDDEAIQRARQSLAGKPIEIWDGARIVGKLQPNE